MVLILEEEMVLTEVVIMLLVSPLLPSCEIFIILIMYVLHSYPQLLRSAGYCGNSTTLL